MFWLLGVRWRWLGWLLGLVCGWSGAWCLVSLVVRERGDWKRRARWRGRWSVILVVWWRGAGYLLFLVPVERWAW